MNAQVSSPPNARGQLDVLAAEQWLAKRLTRHGVLVDPFTGVTDTAIRKQRIRDAIAKFDVAQVICGRNQAGKPMTYAQAFEKLYGEKL